MAGSVNKCLFIGRLGRDPETKILPGGAVVCNFSMAVSETWKDKNSGEKKESTTWVPVVVWGPLADIAGKYLRRGSRAYVAGKFSVRKWQDKSGADRYSTEVVLQGFSAELVLLGDSNGAHDAGQSDYDDSPAPAAAATRGNYANKQLANPNDPSDLGNYGLGSDHVPF